MEEDDLVKGTRYEGNYYYALPPTNTPNKHYMSRSSTKASRTSGNPFPFAQTPLFFYFSPLVQPLFLPADS